MTRVRLIGARAGSEEEEGYQWSLRPLSLEEYIGQRHVVARLSISLAAANKRGEPLDHTLLYGPPGLGKTTLAHIISREMNSKIISTSGPAIERTGDLMGVLTNLEAGDVLFIDEIHRLPRNVEEFLYQAMEDFQVDFVVDKGAFAKTIKIPLKPFTLVGATTRAGLLSSPLRERFGIFCHLDFYPPEELEQVITRSAAILRTGIDREAAREIALRSRGTPRVANRLLKRVRDYAQVRGSGHIDGEVVRLALQLEGIDGVGLDHLDRRFLEAIARVYKGGPVGIQSLAATLNEEVDTLTDLVEPFLLKIGFLSRTPSGRKITERGLAHLGTEKIWGQEEDDNIQVSNTTPSLTGAGGEDVGIQDN